MIDTITRRPLLAGIIALILIGLVISAFPIVPETKQAVVVRFGKPLDFSRYAGMENDRYILRSITDEIMYEIMRLSGQEYVDLYASKAKELDKEKAKKAAAEQAERDKAEREKAGDGPEQKAS